MAATGKGKQIAAEKSPASAASSSGKRRNQRLPSEDDGGSSRRKKRRPGVLQFFDTDAVDAEDDSEEDDDLVSEDEDIDSDFVDHDKSGTKHSKAYGNYPLPFFLKEEELSGDELEELIRDRYGRGSEHVVYGEEYNECEEDTADDPPIWRVKCMIGREKQIAFCLMQKFVDLQAYGTKLKIISVFSLEHVKGYVYIEADKANDVAEACNGFCNLYPTRAGLVPRNEVPHLLSVRNMSCELSNGKWVRVKSGKYKGDLAQVVAVDEGRKNATVKLVPRIDLQAIAKKFGGGLSLKQAAVPPPRLISSRDLEGFRTLVETRHDRQTGEIFEVLDGMMLKNGYLYKKLSMASLICWGVQPSNAELLKFTEANEDESDDLNWVSSVYGRNKMRKTETSSGEMSDKQGSGFELHDLVLFGQKAFGVIIAMEKDCIRILKGDMEVPEVLGVKRQEIKKYCSDKMFTASDQHLKTISISDTVKVLEGSLEGKQGIVRHMYKGTLFIHDESQEENGGFFCVKSKLCENIKESTESCVNSGVKSRSSFPQSSIRSFDQTDNTRSFNQRCHNDRDQTFSIGQTMRIRKGPLKGYLCRVVGVYRNDVTVKLDSLVKVITVQGDLLCPPKSISVTPATIPANTFGTQDFQPIGGLSNVDKSSWDSDLPSVGRDSWQAFSTSAVAGDDDKEAGVDVAWRSKATSGAGGDSYSEKDIFNKQGAGDSWGSKISSGARDQERSDDPWGAKAASGAGDKQGADDPWGSKISSGTRDEEKSDDPWGAKTASGAGDKQGAHDSGGSKILSGARDEEKCDDPWGAKAASGAGDKQGADDSLGSKISFGARDQERSDDPWGSKMASGSKGREQVVDDSWGAKAAPGAGDQERSNDPWGSKMASDLEHGVDDAWGTNAASGARDQERSDDPWGSKMASGSKDQEQGANDAWNQTSAKSSKGSDRWDKAQHSTNEEATLDNMTGTWGKARTDDPLKQTGITSSWDKAATTTGEGKDAGWERRSNWTRSEVAKNDNEGAWDVKGKRVITNEENDWDKATGSQNKSTQENEWSDSAHFKTHNWGKAETADGWGKAASSSQRQTDDWNKPKSFGGDQLSGWNKVDSEEAGLNEPDSWAKPRNTEGGRGYGRGRGMDEHFGDKGNDGQGTWQKPMGRDGGQGRDWRRENVGAGELKDRESSWNQQRDFGGGRASSRGRGGGGRGRYGGSGGRDPDAGGRGGRDRDGGGRGSNWGSSGRGWESGSGRGRGRNGDRDDSSSRGLGQGRGRGRFQSSDWKNDCENSGNGTFSQSGWGNDQNGSWEKSKCLGMDKESIGNVNQQGQWNTGKSMADKQAWSTPKQFGNNRPTGWSQETPFKDASRAGGNTWNSTGWDNKSAENEHAGKSGVGSSWGSAEPINGKQSSGWNDSMPSGNRSVVANVSEEKWDMAKSSDKKQATGWNTSTTDNQDSAKQLADSAGECDNWNKPKPRASAQADNTSNWNVSKESGSGVPSVWNQSSVEAAGKGADNSGGNNWSRQKIYPGKNQSSDWNNDGESSWGKRGDQRSGWQGNTSNQGRGRGSGGGFSAWNGGADTGKEGIRSGDQEEFAGRGGAGGGRSGGRGRSGSWNGGCAGDTGSWYNGSGAADERTTDGGGWNQQKTTGVTGSNASAASRYGQWGGTSDGGNARKGGVSSWSQKEAAWDEGTVAGQAEGSNTRGSGDAGGWKTSAVSAKKEQWGGPSDGGNARKGGVSSWSQKEAAWGEGTVAGQAEGSNTRGSGDAGGWKTSAVSAKKEQWGGPSNKAEEASRWEQGTVAKDANAGDGGSSWDRATASKTGSGGNGGW